MRRKLSQTGDTIVEVLIAMTVVSMILGGAYVTSRHSLTATRQAEEQSEALQIVQGQAEALRGLSLAITPASAASASAPYNIFNEPHVFCLDSNRNILEGIFDAGRNPINIGDFPSTNEGNSNYQTGGGNSGCVFSPQGGVNYDISIDRCDSNDMGGAHVDCNGVAAQPSGAALFLIRAHWDSLTQGRQNVALEYRVYPEGAIQ